jgi:hypothetical protein
MVCFHFYVGPEIAKRTLETAVSTGLGDTASAEKAIIRWLGRPRIEYRGFSIRKSGDETDWVHAERIILTPRLSSLFSPPIRWRKLEVERPTVRLFGKKPALDTGQLGAVLSQSGRVEIRDGHIQWPDKEIEGLFVSFGDSFGIGSSRLVIHAAIREGDDPSAWVSMKGKVHRPPTGEDFSELAFAVEIEAKDLDPLWLGGDLGGYLPTGLGETRVSLAGHFRGNLSGRFASSGTMNIRGCPFVAKGENLTVDYVVHGDNQRISLEKIRLRDLGVRLEGTGQIAWGKEEEPLVSWRVSCPWTSIRNAQELILLFPEEIRSQLRAIQQGEFNLVSLGFSGPIRDLEFSKDEATVLRWRGDVRFRDTIVTWHGETYELSEGWVKLDRGRVVGEIRGLKTGSSHVDHAGFSLSRLFGETSVGLTVAGSVHFDDVIPWITSDFVPQGLAGLVDDLEDLSGQGKVDLEITTSLHGKAPPVISGRLSFDGVGFHTRHLPGTFSGMTGSLRFLSGGAVLENLHGRWGRSTLGGEALIRSVFSKDPEIECSVTGHLDLKDLTEFMSWEGMTDHIASALRAIVSPQGEGDYRLAVKGRLGMPGGLTVSGDLTIQNAAFSLWDAYPMHGVSGRISFADDRVSVSDLRGQWKNSSLGLDVVVTKTGKTDSRDLVFSADFDVQDVASEPFERGWPRRLKKILRPFEFRRGRASVVAHNRKRGNQDTVEGRIHFHETTVRYLPVFPPLTAVEGEVTFDAKSIKIIHLEARYEESQVSLDGDLTPDGETGPPFLSIHVDQIDCEKIFTWPWFEGVNHGAKDQPPVSVRIQVGQGVFRQIRLSDMKAKLTIRGSQGVFERLTFVSNDGFGLITGTIRLEKDGTISFEFQPHLIHVKASPIIMSFQKTASKQELTGSGSAQGTLRGQGKGVQAIARSLDGEVDLFLENGRLAEFSIVSKVFSLLDLSWLLRADIPDLKTEGMAYRTISGRVMVREGVASTDNLLLESESMKITAVGSLHILSGKLDLRLGIRRLGLGGRIMSKVPFFGEIVTEDDGSFINYYFTVKGTLAKPQVYGIPLESVRDGILGPLQRLLKKPMDWFPIQRDPDFERFLEDDEYRSP